MAAPMAGLANNTFGFVTDWESLLRQQATGQAASSDFGPVSATAVAIAASGATIATAVTASLANGIVSFLGTSRVNPAAPALTAILQAGTFVGQYIQVVNEAAAANYVQFDVVGTSNVVGGAAIVIPGGTTMDFIWAGATPHWQPITGAAPPTVSATAVAMGGNGLTIATAGLVVSRVNVTGALTGGILQAGTYDGQTCYVLNEGSGSQVFAAVATSHVSNGASLTIATLTGQSFVYSLNAATPAWYPV